MLRATTAPLLRRLHRNCFACLISLLIACILLTLFDHLVNNISQSPSKQESLSIGSPAAQKDESLPSQKSHSESSSTATPRLYKVHIWHHGDRMKRRFLRSYGKKERDPFGGCSVRNCELTVDDSRMRHADAVVFHLHRTKGPHTLPVEARPSGQIWIFFTDESPHHTFLETKKYKMSDYNGLFNWSMTYRSDSDIPVPYGKTVELRSDEEPEEVVPAPSRRTGGVAVLGSNCGGRNHRWEYVHELRRHLGIDVYGGCGPLKCPGHFTRDCLALDNYKFYLAFENSNCDEYITEKLWWNAYQHGSVPVVMGPPKAQYERLCPPGSFLHVEDFSGPSELAAHLSHLLKNETAYNAFHTWRQKYRVLNEHGYFGAPSKHLCHICEALNSPKKNKVHIYNDLASFWNPRTDCHLPSWSPDHS